MRRAIKVHTGGRCAAHKDQECKKCRAVFRDGFCLDPLCHMSKEQGRVRNRDLTVPRKIGASAVDRQTLCIRGGGDGCRKRSRAARTRRRPLKKQRGPARDEMPWVTEPSAEGEDDDQSEAAPVISEGSVRLSQAPRSSTDKAATAPGPPSEETCEDDMSESVPGPARLSSEFDLHEEVEYYSSTFGGWMPAAVVDVDDDGGIVLNVKRRTRMSASMQSQLVRARGADGGIVLNVQRAAVAEATDPGSAFADLGRRVPRPAQEAAGAASRKPGGAEGGRCRRPTRGGGVELPGPPQPPQEDAPVWVVCDLLTSEGGNIVETEPHEDSLHVVKQINGVLLPCRRMARSDAQLYIGRVARRLGFRPGEPEEIPPSAKRRPRRQKSVRKQGSADRVVGAADAGSATVAVDHARTDRESLVPEARRMRKKRKTKPATGHGQGQGPSESGALGTMKA